MHATSHTVYDNYSRKLWHAGLLLLLTGVAAAQIPKRSAKGMPQLEPLDSPVAITPATTGASKDEASLLIPGEGQEEVRRAEVAESSAPKKPAANPSGRTTDYSAPLGPVRPLSPLMPEGPLSGEGASAQERQEQGSLPDKAWQFSIETRFIFDDNIYLASDTPAIPGGRGKVSDTAILVSPGVRYQHGDVAGKKGSYALISYSPSVSYFTGGTADTALDHNLKLDVQKQWGKLAIGFDGKFQHLTGATAELSDRVTRNEFGARVRSTYEVSDRTSLQASAGYMGTQYQQSGLASFDEFLAETTGYYELTGRTKAGVSLGAGRLQSDGFGAQTYQRALLRAENQPGGKVTFTASGGLEVRDTPAGNSSTPVFNAGAHWQITDGTKASVQVSREITASGSLAGDNVNRTGTTVKLEQRLGGRLAAGLDVGYDNLEYSDAGRAAPQQNSPTTGTRSDDYLFVRPSLRYEFLAGRRAEIYYSLRRDNSSVSDFSFESNQIGLSLGLEF